MPSDEQKKPTPDDASGRSFLKTSARGALLLPYITPAIESIFLSEAHADGDDDDDDDDGSSSSSRASGKPSLLGNEPPPPPGNTNESSDANTDPNDDRQFGEPPPDKK